MGKYKFLIEMKWEAYHYKGRSRADLSYAICKSKTQANYSLSRCIAIKLVYIECIYIKKRGSKTEDVKNKSWAKYERLNKLC